MLADHFSLHKYFYISFAVFIIIGLILGLVTGFKFSGDLKLEHLADSALIKYIDRDISILSLFFTRVITLLGLFILIWIVNFKVFSCFIAPILIIYRAFLLGLNCAVLILLFKLGGVLNVLIVYIPCHLITLMVLSSFGAVCMRYCFYAKQLSTSCFSKEFIYKHSRILMFLGLVILAACILEAIILPLFTASFFINNS